MFECARRGTLCDGTCIDCPRERFKPKTQEEYEEEIRKYGKSQGVKVPESFVTVVAVGLLKESTRAYEDFMRILGLSDTAPGGPLVGRTSFPTNRKETPCTHCGPVNGAAHVGLCATCAAFVDLDSDVVT